MTKKIFALLLALTLTATVSYADRRVKISPRNAENVISEPELLNDIRFLSDTLCSGRRTGSRGSQLAAFWIGRQMEATGLLRFEGVRCQGFPTASGKSGHNVIGFLPGTERQGKRYIIIGAHYDHLGNLGGVLYPGADSNASGVVGMLALARMLQTMSDIDRPFAKSVIFVAFDGKETNMAGSAYLAARLRQGSLTDPVTRTPISAKDVALMVNLDQIGSSLSPRSPVWKEYLIMLAGGNARYQNALKAVDIEYRIGLDLGFDYYGSRDFTRIFYHRVCDQKAFLDIGVESVLFTSGITMNNNKPYDVPENLDIPLLRKRIILIYYWLRRFL